MAPRHSVQRQYNDARNKEVWHRDTQHNDISNRDTQHKDILETQ